MDGLHLTEFPDGPSQPTSQVCGAILFSLALSDLLFAGCLPIPSQVSELLLARDFHPSTCRHHQLILAHLRATRGEPTEPFF